MRGRDVRHDTLRVVLGVLLFASGLGAPFARAAEDPPRVHSVSDISQEFTFYMDGRFHRQYLADVGKDVRNWGSLSRLDLSNVNLLILSDGNPRIPYAPESITHIRAFVEKQGGTLLVLGDASRTKPPVLPLLEGFGAGLAETRAAEPLQGRGELEGVSITFRGGGSLVVDDTWTPLVLDAEGKPMLAVRRAGKGHVVLSARGLIGHRPDASDPINADWVTPLLVSRATSKSIDPKKPHQSTWVEHKREVGPLMLEYHDGTERFADSIVKEYHAVRPHMVAITGVEAAPGMVKRLLVLPTGGGGFSSGVLIAIGAWWGNYPETRYPMVELIAHEAGHSWVLPHPEPLWNDPIATWFGIQVGRRMGMPEADATLAKGIERARRLDPELDKIDPLSPKAPRDVVWGKSYHVFEELERRYGPGAMAKYFRVKRARIDASRPSYSMDDCVAIWSLAVGEDLFPFFRSLAFDVDASKTDIDLP